MVRCVDAIVRARQSRRRPSTAHRTDTKLTALAADGIDLGIARRPPPQQEVDIVDRFLRAAGEPSLRLDGFGGSRVRPGTGRIEQRGAPATRLENRRAGRSGPLGPGPVRLLQRPRGATGHSGHKKRNGLGG